MNQSPLLEDLRLRFGCRFNTYDGTFRNDMLRTFAGVDRWVNGQEFERDWDNNALDLGLVYSPTSTTTLFASYATTFRVPNVDELALAIGELVPQEGKHMDIGIRHKIRGIAELSLTLFQIDIEDEIFFDAAMNVNRNFEDKTRRRGVEIDFKLYPFESIYLWGNYTYMEAQFERTDAFVPLVPENTASLGLEWQILEPLVLALTGTYVGSKFDGNDLSNSRFAKIDSYAVADGKITYTWKDLKVFFSVNNIFDKYYETLAFSESYYTMPTRNFYGGVQWTF
jgi:outer membrane receptor protein involved in Fe transport